MNMSHKEFFNENQSRNYRNETFIDSNYNSYNHKVTEKVPDQSRSSLNVDESGFVVP